MEFFGHGAHVYNAYLSLVALFLFFALTKHFTDKDSKGTVYWLKNLMVFLCTVVILSISVISIMSFASAQDTQI